MNRRCVSMQESTSRLGAGVRAEREGGREGGKSPSHPTNQRRRRPLLNDSPHTPSRLLIPFVHSEGERAKLSAVPNNYL